jgi:hypothetical protein
LLRYLEKKSSKIVRKRPAKKNIPLEDDGKFYQVIEIKRKNIIFRSLGRGEPHQPFLAGLEVGDRIASMKTSAEKIARTC